MMMNKSGKGRKGAETSTPMTLSPCGSVASLVIGLLAVVCAVNAAAQEAVLQLNSPGPAAGSIESSAPSISCATTCTLAVTLGDTVVLTATPAPGNQFDAWAGDCWGSGTTCALVMDGTKLAVASFKPAGDPLTVIHRFLPGGPDGSSLYGELLAYGGYLFGTTSGDGSGGAGTIFRERPDGSEYTVLHDFLGGAFDGRWPDGLLIASGGVLYGMTTYGGANDGGTIFKVNPDGSSFALLHSFAGGAADGRWPSGALVASDGVLYGMTTNGGAGGAGFSEEGTIFKMNPDGSGFVLLHSFANGGGPVEGGRPYGSLTASDGALYGMTSETIFRINSDGSGFALLHSFDASGAEGREPHGSLTAFGGALYGMTAYGGAFDAGVIFKVNPDGRGFALLHSFSGGAFDGSHGYYPFGSLIASGGVLYGMTTAGGTSGLGTVFKINPDGSGFGLLHSFAGGPTDGRGPYGSLIDAGRVLYGMSSGTIFKINPDGSGFVVLHSFPGGASDGRDPSGSLVDSGGVLYGMTSQGGASSLGTIFKVNPDGSGWALLHSFTGGASDGRSPSGSLIASGGVIYGMTAWGGASNLGTIFKINPDGSGFALLHSFAGYFSDGAIPFGSLTAYGGVLYGMTMAGGASNAGTVFKVNPDGKGFALLRSFAYNAAEGYDPFASLIASGGELFGMTGTGGAGAGGAIFKMNPDGTGFALLHSFAAGATDGSNPHGSLIASGGVIYGMTTWGGASNLGTIFRINPDGNSYALLHSFAGGTSGGAGPTGSLVALGGVLYGMTAWGGTNDLGTVFKVNPDGSSFALVHSFGGGDGAASSGEGDGASPSGGFAGGDSSSDRSLIALAGSLYGAVKFGGLTNGGVLFRLDLPEHRLRRHLQRR